MKRIPYGILFVSFVYLSVLAVKSFSWAFISSDSGGFLSAVVSWSNPQPYGAPLYILLGHFLNLFGHVEVTMPIFLSALPGAITVTFTYLIVKKWTQSIGYGIISSMILLGSAVFLAESTVLIYHTFAAMFVTLALWAFINEKRKLTGLFLGLGISVHVMVLTIAFVWILCDVLIGWKQKTWKWWAYKPILILLAVGGIPYSMVLIIMALDTPKFLAGGLNYDSIMGYWTSTSKAIVGTISVFEFPARFYNTSKIILMSFGLALIPMVYFIVRCIKRKETQRNIIALGAITGYTFWYVLTCMDAQTWTYLVFASAPLAIAAGCGLYLVKKFLAVTAVGVGALSLIVVNVFFMNANSITNENPIAERYLTELNSLPDGAIVLTEPGPYSMGMFYAINKGKNIVPLVYPYLDDGTYGRADFASYVSNRWGVDFQNATEVTKKWKIWLQHIYGTDKVNWVDVPEAVAQYHIFLLDMYGVNESGTLLVVSNALKDGRPIYAATEWYSIMNQAFVREGEGLVKEITSLTGLQPAPYKKSAKGTLQNSDPFTR